jgi:hypothetical protein
MVSSNGMLVIAIPMHIANDKLNIGMPMTSSSST